MGEQLDTRTQAEKFPNRGRYGCGDGRVDPSELRRLLIDLAPRGALISYGEVATAFGEPWHQGFGSSLKRALNILGDENRSAGEPLLMVLVVNKETRQPGGGYYNRIGEARAGWLQIELLPPSVIPGLVPGNQMRRR